MTMKRINSLFVFLCLSAASAVEERQFGPAEVDWDESFEAFVPYPVEAKEYLKREESEQVRPLFLDVVVNLAQWEDKRPVLALLKGIVARNHPVVSHHHYFIQNGWIFDHSTGESSQCRSVDGKQVKFKNCTDQCTNHGRYCLSQGGHSLGADLVKESLRRMCFEVFYEAGSTILWKYMDAFDKANCKRASNMTDCSMKVMDSTAELRKNDILACVNQMGGFDGDNKNIGLEQELKKEQTMHVSHTKDLPLLEIAGSRYTGDFEVKPVFQAVCDAFPTDSMPFACEFCGGCQDVRKCLWHLECDGEPLDPGVFAIKKVAGSQETSAADEDENDSTGPTLWHIGFLWGTILGLCVAMVFAYKQMQTMRLIKELAKNRDDLEDDFQPRNIDALVEALDMKLHGSTTTSCESTPTSVSLSSSVASTPPVSDDEPSYSSEGEEISLPSVV